MRAIVFLLLTLISADALAYELTGSVGTFHLPDSNYHYSGAAARFATGERMSHLVFDLGMIPPYRSHGTRQMIGYAAVGGEWDVSRWRFLDPYMGVSGALYWDHVGSQKGWVPGLLTKAGVKMGSEDIGVDFCVMNILGVYDPGELQYFVVWPMINFIGGVYVRF